MTTCDWPLIQQRSGQAIEDLVATLMRLEFPEARQVNPSQGDGGIDVLRSVNGTIEVWQVKSFTVALNSNQWRQVRLSWERFWEEHVECGDTPVVGYHLVTPWTPTEERMEDFRQLTRYAEFSCSWESDAFLSGLADKHPATMQRFVYGEKVLEHFITQKAMIAASPIERGEAVTMLGAVRVRQEALDAIVDAISDNYRIERGTRTVMDRGAIPLPDPEDPAIFQRITYLGEQRWSYESLVPRSQDSATIEPIEHSIEYLDPPGTPGYEAVQGWLLWGTPFKDVNARTFLRGGPFADDRPTESIVSIFESESGDRPRFYLRVATSDASPRFRLPLTTVTQTVGVETGWLHLVVRTPGNVVEINLRFKSVSEVEAKLVLGAVGGFNPEAIRDETAMLLTVARDDIVTVETSAGAVLFRARDLSFPSALESLYLPISTNLTVLQSRTSSNLVMPDIRQVTDDELHYLANLTSIYSGKAHTQTWTSITLHIPSDQGVEIPFGTGYIVRVIQPVFELGDRTYEIDHPLASSIHSSRLEDGADLRSLEPGEPFKLVPGDDDGVTTAMVVDWTPGSLLFDTDRHP